MGRVSSREMGTSGVPTPWDARKATPAAPSSQGAAGPCAVIDPVHASIFPCARIGRSSVWPPPMVSVVRAVNPLGARRR